MKWHHFLVIAVLGLPLWAPSVKAQQAFGAPVVTADNGHPAELSSARSKAGLVYVDSRGMALYALNSRIAAFFAGGGAGGGGGGGGGRGSANAAAVLKFCSDACAQTWIAVRAAADAKPVGEWKVVDGASGPQWAYKGDPVFTFVRDGPGSTGGLDVEDDIPLFRLLNYVPPLPKVAAPAPVAVVFVGEAYILENGQGHALFTSGKRGSCGTACGTWTAFAAPMASRGIGDWTVSRDGDRPQWAYRGQLVYVSEESRPNQAPAGGTVLAADETPSQPGPAGTRIAASEH